MIIQTFIKYNTLFLLIFLLFHTYPDSALLAQPGKQLSQSNSQQAFIISNNHTILPLNNQWEMISFNQDWSAEVELPIVISFFQEGRVMQ